MGTVSSHREGVEMSGKYNRCPYCNSLRKRYMPLGEQKLCIDCYEEMAGSAWIKEQKEND